MSHVFPAAYRARYLPAMTPAQIAALSDKAWAPVIVTTGAVEQHGPHLPVGVDALLGQAWLTHALALLPAETSCYVAPAIVVGKSNEHVGFPGTLIVSKETLRGLLLSLARQLNAWGFRQLAVLNTHGGNSAVIGYTLREIESAYGLRTARLRLTAGFDVSPQEAAYGFHAGEIETSLVLALAPHLVRPECATCEYPAQLEDPGELRPEKAPVTFSWATQDVSRSGVMGDATAATVEKGRRWLEQGAVDYAASIAGLCRESRKAAGGP